MIPNLVFDFSSIKIFYNDFFTFHFFSFLKNYFCRSKKYFFDRKKKLRKFSIHYIDVKFSDDSIFSHLQGISAFWTTLRHRNRSGTPIFTCWLCLCYSKLRGIVEFASNLGYHKATLGELISKMVDGNDLRSFFPSNWVLGPLGKKY